MKIKQVTMYHVQLPMKFKFKTAKGALNLRDTIILKVEDFSGLSGFGEVVSFTTPFYTAETLEASFQKLCEEYLPFVLENEISHPFDLHSYFDNPLPMAMAGLENALLDLYFKGKNQNIIQGIFKEELKSFIPRGAVLGEMSPKELNLSINRLFQEGVRRIKLKISPSSPMKEIKAIIEQFPEVDFAVDANQSFSVEEWQKIATLDELHLVCIEEPFNIKKLSELEEVIKHIETPICFDESVQSLSTLDELKKLPGRKMLNIKIGRLGGLYQVKKTIDFCRNNGLDFWIGSMVESGISKILHVQLAALDGNIMAGDLSDSQHYFDEDLIQPELSFPNGWMKVPKNPGLGVKVDEEKLSRFTIRKEIFR